MPPSSLYPYLIHYFHYKIFSSDSATYSLLSMAFFPLLLFLISSFFYALSKVFTYLFASFSLRLFADPLFFLFRFFKSAGDGLLFVLLRVFESLVGNGLLFLLLSALVILVGVLLFAKSESANDGTVFSGLEILTFTLFFY